MTEVGDIAEIFNIKNPNLKGSLSLDLEIDGKLSKDDSVIEITSRIPEIVLSTEDQHDFFAALLLRSQIRLNANPLIAAISRSLQSHQITLLQPLFYNSQTRAKTPTLGYLLNKSTFHSLLVMRTKN